MLSRSLDASGALPRLVLVFGLVFASPFAFALDLSIDADASAPGIQSMLGVLAGDSVAVDVVIEDVDPLFPLGSFDLVVNYDPAILGLTSITSGGFLPIPFVIPTVGLPGVARFAETSLGGFNSGDGVLVKLVFQALADGTSTISFDESNTLLGGVILGGPFPVPTPITDFGIVNAEVNVGAAPVEVPLPSVMLLMLGGLSAAGLRLIASAKRAAA